MPKMAGTEAYVRIYNTDGSEAEACGNGMRCIGWVVAQQTGRKALKFETSGRRARRRPSHGIDRITVDMGRRGSAGATSRWPRRSTTRAPSSCRSGRSTSRSCTRRRSSTSAIRTRCSGSRMWRPTISAASGRCWRTIRSFPSAPTSRWRTSRLADRHHGAHLGARRRPDQGLRQRRPARRPCARRARG